MKQLSMQTVYGCVLVLILSAMVFCPGCSRASYRNAADEDVYSIIEQKPEGTPWELERGFTIQPSRASRLYLPGDPDAEDYRSEIWIPIKK